MSDALCQSLRETADDLNDLFHLVKSSGLDFGFAEEQLSYQIEGLVSELSDQIDQSLRLAELGD